MKKIFIVLIIIFLNISCFSGESIPFDAVGDCLIFRSIDEFTDLENYTIAIKTKDNSLLISTPKEHKSIIFGIIFDSLSFIYINDFETKYVKYRFDKEQAIEEDFDKNWYVSSTGTSIGLRSHSVSSFINKMLKHDTFILNIQGDFLGLNKTLSFNLKNFKQIFNKHKVYFEPYM